MKNIEISKLTLHPRNEEFFDDIEGGKWEDFKQSIIRRGITNPIIISQDHVVVSGHQRIKACKELDIMSIPCIINTYPDIDPQTQTSKEDQMLEDLICTNIMQRGVGNINPLKLAKCAVELERIYGVREGSHNQKGVNQYTNGESNNFTHKKTQDDIAKELNITKQQLHNYKKLLLLIPELQNMVEDDDLKATTATLLAKRLSKEDQERLVEDIGKDVLSKMTQKKMNEVIEDFKAKEHLLQKELDGERKAKQALLSLQESRQDIVPEHIKNEIQSLRNKLSAKDQDAKYIQDKLNSLLAEKKELEDYINSEKFKVDSQQKELEMLQQKEKLLKTKAHMSLYELKGKINNFIRDSASQIYLEGSMAILDLAIKKDLYESVSALKMYVSNLEDILNGNVSYVSNNKDNIIDV